MLSQPICRNLLRQPQESDYTTENTKNIAAVQILAMYTIHLSHKKGSGTGNRNKREKCNTA